LALNAYARGAVDRVVVPIARGLVRLGATANWLTFTGLVLTVAGIAILLAGHRLAGGIVAGVAGVTDAFDGAVARLRGTSGPLGAFYDSVTDRVGDAVIFGAAAWLVRDDPLLFGLAIVALGGAQVTSYIRAKAESLGWKATVGIMERAERTLVILVAMGFGFEAVGIWVCAIGSVVTIAQRLRAVLAQTRTA